MNRNAWFVIIRIMFTRFCWTGQQATDQWYSEIKDYNFSRGGFQSGTGKVSEIFSACVFRKFEICLC